MGRLFWASTRYVKIDELENIYNFMLKNVVYLNMYVYYKLNTPTFV